MDVDQPASIRKVLSVEDSRDSTASLTGALIDAGVEVAEATTIPEATERVSHTRFDYMFIDARMPDVGRFDVRTGIDFIRRVKEGLYGDANVDTPFVVLTSLADEVDSREMLDLSGFNTVIAKASMTAVDLQQLLGIELSLGPFEVPGEYVLEDLLVALKRPTLDGDVELLVPSWSEGDRVIVNLNDLDDDVAVELSSQEPPVYVWARVNLNARTADELQPREFRLHVADPEAFAAFEEVDQ